MTDEKILQVIDVLVASYQTALIELNQIKATITSATALVEEPAVVVPPVEQAQVVVPPVEQEPVVVAPAAATEDSCMGWYDANVPECVGCGDAAACQVATQARIASAGGVVHTPVAEPAVVVPPLAPGAEQAPVAATALTPVDEQALAHLDPQNKQFVIDYAAAEGKTITEVLEILKL